MNLALNSNPCKNLNLDLDPYSNVVVFLNKKFVKDYSSNAQRYSRITRF
jgi:hypothetical protein